MNRTIHRNWIADTCAFSLIFLFVYTASSKLFQFNLFLFQLSNDPWIKHAPTLLAWAVPAIELAAAGFLLAKRRRKIGFYLSLTLMALFTLYLALMLGLGENLHCSCGGVISWMSWKQHLVFNIFFTGVAFMGLVYSSPKIKFYGTEQRV